MERYREELFPDFKGEKKPAYKKKFRGSRLVRERYIKLSEEKLSFILLLLLVCFLLSYLWGYYRGSLNRKAKENLKVSSDTISVEKESVNSASNTSLNVQVKQVKKEIPSPEYVIQLATYGSTSYAQTEKEQLVKKGYSVFIGKKGKYIILYVGKYKTRKEAEKNLRRLRTIYKDAFVKKIEGGG